MIKDSETVRGHCSKFSLNFFEDYLEIIDSIQNVHLPKAPY